MTNQTPKTARPPAISFLIILDIFSAVALTFFVALSLLPIESISTKYQAFFSMMSSSYMIILFCVNILFNLILAYGLYTRRRWSIILHYIVAFFILFSFPIGTIIALITFTQLHTNAAKKYFSNNQPKSSPQSKK